MNREIKFRCFTPKNSTIVYEGWNNESFVSKREIFAHGDDAIIMQYTGLKDKNGKEIYEGDICRLIPTEENKHNSPHMVGIRTVYWDETYFSWYFTGFVTISWGGFESIEVIGNIYENPELLK